MKSNVLERIIRQAEHYPYRTAIHYAGREVSYRQLASDVKRIAMHMKTIGIGKEDVAAVYMERSYESVCAELGIMAAGAAFLPIDAKTPTDRVLYMLKQAEAKYIWKDTHTEQLLPVKKSMEISGFLSLGETETFTGHQDWLPRMDDGDLAYVIFTSGSTGLPKGVMIEYGGMENHLNEKISLLHLEEESVVVFNASVGFDISVWQMMTPLCVGGTLVIMEESDILHIKNFIRIMVSKGVTVLEVTPSFLNVMIQYSQKKQIQFPRLKYVLSTGEALSSEIAARWFQNFTIPLINAYGPTETSDDITHCRITQQDIYSEIPIGRPIANAVFYVMDRDGNPCGEHEMGELWVSGICVGRGYIGNEDETNKHFCIDPATGFRLYKTGDIVALGKDGNYRYYGRIDSQIKLHGHRIEIKEIESVMLSCEGITQAMVVYDQEKETLTGLYTSGEMVGLPQLKKCLREKLPEYMIPASFMQMKEIPLSLNGKMDYKKGIELARNGRQPGMLKFHPKDVEGKLTEILQLVTGKDAMPGDRRWKSDLRLAGLNSVTAMNLIVEIEEAFGLELDDEILTMDVLYDFHKIMDYIKKSILSQEERNE